MARSCLLNFQVVCRHVPQAPRARDPPRNPPPRDPPPEVAAAPAAPVARAAPAPTSPKEEMEPDKERRLFGWNSTRETCGKGSFAYRMRCWNKSLLEMWEMTKVVMANNMQWEDWEGHLRFWSPLAVSQNPVGNGWKMMEKMSFSSSSICQSSVFILYQSSFKLSQLIPAI